MPLPAQALDHGAGYLLAAGVCRALTRRLLLGEASNVRTSLARVARFLMDADETPIAEDRELTAQDAEPWLETGDSAWGPLARVRCPGRIDAVASGWSRTPGPLATDLPAW